MNEKIKKQDTIKGLNALKRIIRRKQWIEASQAPAFLKDVAQIEADFRIADIENLGNAG